MSTTIDGSASVTINSGAVLGITSGTAVASTSGTSIDFTSIPSWVKRITVMFQGVSTNGTSNLQIQTGDSGGVETSGYTSNPIQLTGGTNVGVSITSGFGITSSNAAAATISGHAVLTLIDSGATWIFSSNTAYTATAIYVSSGTKALSPGPLTTVRITTVNGTDTFDAGSINILYE
jgi:hypothetical protein